MVLYINSYLHENHPDGLVQHYDAETGVTTSGSDVTDWEDQSGNGYDAEQTTSARRPTLGTSIQNGLDGVFFDNGTAGSEQYMTTGANQPKEETVVGVFKRVTSGAVNGNLTPSGGDARSGKGSVESQYLLSNSADNRWAIGVAGGFVSSDSGSNDTTKIVSCRTTAKGGRPISIKTNDGSWTSSTRADAAVSSEFPLYIGCGTTTKGGGRANYFHGYVFEFKRWNRQLTDSEIDDEIDDLNTKWSVF